ncbi:hypothetical protein [Saccharothrix coeruleofusca]|uniref:DUF3618 domain-containing protein n=1 Tax=Saccharothrix coeruleofusca TaxID=33919 RepID=A0A918EF87_9PSEU|nr:hypothetical protein [Saccharothrix coeruleofusca]MBP2335121.1 vacuolar-type H+-ATPase subunit H [Saccharothrix coeruleofusca]GGP70998.1 hypothetical protein GCM10010185_50020 [Saccharothrix coeruleofusca]
MTENQMGAVRGAAKEEGAAVAQHARQAAGDVGSTAGEQVRQVAQEAGAQARHAVHDVRERVASEAEQQAQRVSQQLNRIADELTSMAEGSSQSMTSGAIRQVADTSRQAARFIDERGARGLLDSAQDFARRKPGAFLLGAAVAGFLVGRIAKGATGQGGQHEVQQVGRTPQPAGYSVPPVSAVETTTPMGTAPVGAPTPRTGEEPVPVPGAYPTGGYQGSGYQGSGYQGSAYQGGGVPHVQR